MGTSRWCETCGKELTGQPSLPTEEALEAGRREAVWLDAHPDVAQREWKSGEMQARERAQLAFERGTYTPGPPVEPARDPSGLAKAARWLLFGQVGLAVVTGIVEILYLDSLSGTTPEEYPVDATVSDIGLVVVALYGIQFLSLLVTAGVFIAWLYRVYKNTQSLGAYELRFGPGWAIGGWFVPILAWWRPKQIVNDAWRASDPELPAHAHKHQWEDTDVPPIFLLWWLLFNVWSFVQQASGQYLSQSELTLDEDRTGTIMSLCAAVPCIAAALLGAHVVKMVTERQNARAAAREQMPPPAMQAQWGTPPPAAPVQWGTPPPAPPAQGDTPPSGQDPPRQDPPQQWLPPGGQV